MSSTPRSCLASSTSAALCPLGGRWHDGSLAVLLGCALVILPGVAERAAAANETPAGAVLSAPDPSVALASGARALAAGAAAAAIPLLEAGTTPGAPLADLSWLLLGRALLEAGRPEEALAAARRVEGAVTASVRGAEALWLEAEALEALGRHALAARAFESVAGKAGVPSARREEALVRAEGAMEQAGEWATAAAALRKLTIEEPQATDDEALTRARALALRAGVAFAEPSCEELADRAGRLARAARHPRAVLAWQEAAARCAQRTGLADRALHEAASAAYLLRQNDESLAAATELERRFPQSKYVPGARLLRARVAWRLDRPVEAAALAEGVAGEARWRHSEWRDEVLRVRGAIAVEGARHAEAVTWMDRLVAEHPQSGLAEEARYKAAWSRLLEGQHADAVTRFQAVARGRDDRFRTSAAFWAAEAARRAGDEDGWTRGLRALAVSDPHDFHGLEARRLLAELLSPEGLALLDRQAEAGAVVLAPPARPALASPSGQRHALLAAAGLWDFALPEIEAHRRSVKDTDGLVLELCRARVRAGRVQAAQVLLESRFREALAKPSRRSARELWKLRYPLPEASALRTAAAAHAVDPALCAAIARSESWWDPRARSVADARGLMQLMPSTAARLAAEEGLPAPSPDDLFDPALNLRLGCRHVSELLRAFGGDEAAAIASYNAGPEKVGQWWAAYEAEGITSRSERVDRIPYRETRPYVRRVLEAAAWYRWLLQ